MIPRLPAHGWMVENTAEKGSWEKSVPVLAEAAGSSEGVAALLSSVSPQVTCSLVTILKTHHTGAKEGLLRANLPC